MSGDSEQRIGARRLTILALCITFGFSVLIGQLVRYQVLMHAELADLWRKDVVDIFEEFLARGTIVDRRGHLMCLDVVQWDIEVNPPLIDDPGTLAGELAPLVGIPKDDLLVTLSDRGLPWALIASGVDQDLGERIASIPDPGLDCHPRPLRQYSESALTSHVLGIVNETGTGFYGVEGFYNIVLMAIPGERVSPRAGDGKVIAGPAITHNPPKAGTSLVLTLDLNIQYIAAEELLNALDEYQAQSGTIIVMDPKTGDILASVSYPAYDPNDFAATDPDLLSDPAVSKMWEPGSIFKIVTWAAALDAGSITRFMTHYDTGSIEVGGRIIRNWDRKAYGLVTMEEALIESLNTVAAHVSTSLGSERFYTYVRRFGFGSLTGVDLASEGPGMVKLPGDANWFPSDLGTNPFGQGIAVTPIQMISAVSAVANQGLLVQPHIVHQFITQSSADGQERVIQVEPTIERRAISAQAAKTLTDMLVEVVEQGATNARVPGYRIAGKTGTAQIPTAYGYDPSDTIASFVGFAPADDPEFIVLVKLDRPKASPWGSQTAARAFRAIAERLFTYLEIPPDGIRVANQSQTP